jgi:hypothetical protein
MTMPNFMAAARGSAALEHGFVRDGETPETHEPWNAHVKMGSVSGEGDGAGGTRESPTADGAHALIVERRLFLGGIPPKATEQDIERRFSAFPALSVSDVYVARVNAGRRAGRAPRVAGSRAPRTCCGCRQGGAASGGGGAGGAAQTYSSEAASHARRPRQQPRAHALLGVGPSDVYYTAPPQKSALGS